MEEFSQWLNAQLKKHGLTANGFAQKAGMNSTSIKNYTKGRPVKPDQEKKIRDIFRAIESGEDFQADEQPINPGIHSDGYNPLKEAYEQLMRRVADLEQWNSDLKADKRNLQEQIQNMWQSMGIIRQAQAADDQPKGSANFQIGKNSGRTGLEVVSPKRTINREHLVLGGRLLTVAIAR